MKELATAQDILEQSLCLNKYIKISNNTAYWKPWINAGIPYINDIMHNETFFILL